MKYPKAFNHLFDLNYIKKHTPNFLKLKVTLKKTKFKGLGLFANADIKKGTVIAYYKIKIFRESTYKSPTKTMYTFSVYTKSGNISRTFVGDLVPESLQPPKNGIPFWAYYSNEPSPPKQIENCYIDTWLSANYKNKSRVKEGDYMIYRLVTTKNLKKGDEICWCYGDSYHRNYTPNC